MTARGTRRIAAIAAALIGAAAIGFSGVAHGAPGNDDFAGATIVGSLPFTATQPTSGATTQAAEPAPCGLMGATVWYRFTATQDARLQAHTMGSDFDTAMAVYRGSSLESLALVQCNDDIVLGINPQSRVTFRVSAGETISIQVGGYAGQAGALSFTMVLQAALGSCPSCPTFVHHVVPDEFANAHRAGETSIGVNPFTDKAFLLMRGQTLRAEFDDTQDPPMASWTDVSAEQLRATNDPILWTDQVTGRTYVVQLRAAAATGFSMIGFTDNDGATWTYTQPGIVAPSWDHQTIGGGPFPLGLQPTVYPHAMYYCAQSGFALSQCARSDNGGLTWGPPLPMNVAQCSGLHGHIAVDAQGNVYVPHGSCADAGGVRRQGVIVSKDGGHTWTRRLIPNIFGTNGSVLGDPKIAFDKGGRMYFVGGSKGKPVAITSDDGGVTWNTPAPIDVGADFGINNTEFTMVVAGDAGRAAFAFYGTAEEGNDQSQFFGGEWQLYVSFTYDGGATWRTSDLTPTDPVQRGCIWLQGGSNPCRNLLDFQDMTIDSTGRVLISWADGCTSAECVYLNGTPQSSRDSLGVISRQVSGKTLYAAFDPVS